MKKEVVKINNEQEWEYVKEKINKPKGLLYSKRYESTKGICINVRNGKYDYVDYYKREGYTIISFEEFKSRYEPQLKIGDTFEHNGFVCKVLHQINEKRWFRLKSPNNKDISYEKLDSEGLKDINHLYTKQEITDQEFIKQLEKYSR